MTYIPPRGKVDAENSTVTPVGTPSASWEGAWVDCSAFASITVLATSDAISTLYVDFSTDGAAVDRHVQVSSGLSGNMGIHSLTPVAQYYRVQVVCGLVAQTTLVVQTLLNTQPKIAVPTSRLSQTLDRYTDVLNTRSALFGIQPGGAVASVGLTENNELMVCATSPSTAFDEASTAETNPLVQIDAVYGIRSNAETFAATGGSVSAADGNFICQTGVSVGGYGVIRSKRAVRYRPGQGCVFRWTAGFDTANRQALSLQAAGPFNSTSGYFVGYNGLDFGVMHRTGGKHQIITLTVNVAATGAETLALTLNSVVYAPTVTAGTAAKNAGEIAAWLTANQSVWDAAQNGSAVVLIRRDVGPASGAYSVTSTGTLTGTFATNATGVVNTETWTLQSAFSVDPLDGTGPSGLNLIPSYGNVYELKLQYLGYGNADFRVENPDTGRFFTFHRFAFPNSRTTPTLMNPTLKVGWVAASLGSSGTSLTVYGASCLGAVQGPLRTTKNSRSTSTTRTGISTTLVALLAIRVRSDFSDVTQLGEVLPQVLNVSQSGSKPLEVKVLVNPTFDTAGSWPNWTYAEELESIVSYDISATTLTSNGREIAGFVVAGAGSTAFSFDKLGPSGLNPIRLVRGDVLLVAAKVSTGAASDVSLSLSWTEDV